MRDGGDKEEEVVFDDGLGGGGGGGSTSRRKLSHLSSRYRRASLKRGVSDIMGSGSSSFNAKNKTAVAAALAVVAAKGPGNSNSNAPSSSSSSSSSSSASAAAVGTVVALRPPAHFLRSTEAWSARKVLNLVFVRRKITRCHIPAHARASAIVMANLDRLSSDW
jgi:hypothetical protein